MIAAGKAFMIFDNALLPIDRVGTGSGRDRPYYSEKHEQHGMNVLGIADPTGRVVRESDALPGARYDMSAARKYSLINTSACGWVHW